LIFLRPAIGFHIEVDAADVRRPHLRGTVITGIGADLLRLGCGVLLPIP
jgi:hypothetical protein